MSFEVAVREVEPEPGGASGEGVVVVVPGGLAVGPEEAPTVTATF